MTYMSDETDHLLTLSPLGMTGPDQVWSCLHSTSQGRRLLHYNLKLTFNLQVLFVQNSTKKSDFPKSKKIIIITGEGLI